MLLQQAVEQFLEIWDDPFSDTEPLEKAIEAMRSAATLPPAPYDPCLECNGTGNWANGMQCNRCAGKGFQTAADRRRNVNYDRGLRYR